MASSSCGKAVIYKNSLLFINSKEYIIPNFAECTKKLSKLFYTNFGQLSFFLKLPGKFIVYVSCPEFIKNLPKVC